jgi:hypothetical protein
MDQANCAPGMPPMQEQQGTVPDGDTERSRRAGGLER